LNSLYDTVGDFEVPAGFFDSYQHQQDLKILSNLYQQDLRILSNLFNSGTTCLCFLIVPCHQDMCTQREVDIFIFDSTIHIYTHILIHTRAWTSLCIAHTDCGAAHVCETMDVYVYIYIFVYTYIYINDIHSYICVRTLTYIIGPIHAHPERMFGRRPTIYVCACVWDDRRIYMHIYIYTYIYMCNIHIYIRTYMLKYMIRPTHARPACMLGRHPAIYVCACLRDDRRIYIYIYMYVFTYMYIYIYITYIYIYVCVRMCMCARRSTCIYMFIYMYLHI